MIDFQVLTLAQIPLLREYFSRSRSRLCDRSLGGAVMWRKSFGTSFALQEDILFFRSEVSPGKWAYTAPLGNIHKGVELLAEHCLKNGEKLSFCSVGEEEKDEILRILPDYRAVATRDWFDYLYLSEKLATFRGKKLSGQRNHRNFFVKNHQDWCFEEISDENIGDVKEFFEYYRKEIQKDSSYYHDETEAVLEVMDHRDEYGFLGGLIRCEGKVCAFSFGEVVGDTFFVHIEKANRLIRGAYQMIVSEMVSHYTGDTIPYVNREEDVGDPGLRYSKESYHPHLLLAKYIVEK